VFIAFISMIGSLSIAKYDKQIKAKIT
jgi:hypothetical protein